MITVKYKDPVFREYLKMFSNDHTSGLAFSGWLTLKGIESQTYTNMNSAVESIIISEEEYTKMSMRCS